MRQEWRLHQNWYFTTEEIAGNIAEVTPEIMPEIWEEITVPHTFRMEPYAHRGVRTAQGVGTYCRCFSLDASFKGKNLYMTFEAVMGVTDVWLNGVHLHTNYGGYLPFVVCLSEEAYFDGTDNILVVRTDNRDNGQVPPGKPQELLDFTYFGGIYRNVWLKAVEPIFITDPLYEKKENSGGILLEYPYVSAEKAIIEVKTQLRSTQKKEQKAALVQKIIGADGTCAACRIEEITMPPHTAKDILMEMEITNPNLWNLNSPALYDLVTAVVADGTVIDQKKTRFGIRQIEVDREKGVLINGEVQPLLSGVNRHQDYPVIGNAAPSSMQRRDAILIKNAGFHVVRAAHYPMSEDFLDACDELGLLLFEATPGWQWYPTDQPEPFTSRVRENIRQMVRRDRNHPCILAYEIVLNETYHVPNGFTRKSALTALAEQKSAKIAAESYGYDASPKANGLDRESHFIYGFEQPLEKTEKAVMFLREYADCWIESYGEFESRRVTRGRTNGFYPCKEARNLKKANQMLWQNLKGEYSLAKCYALREENPAFTGCAIWTGIDSRGARSEIGPCGIWDGYRLPKISYWAFASQQEKTAVLYLASEWTKTAPVLDKTAGDYLFGTDDFRDIFVYSNAAEVVLTVERGDELLWEKAEKPHSKGMAAYLPHPPFYFAGVPYTEGTVLHACGYDAYGKLIAEDKRQTAGIPHHICLRAEFLGIPMQADGNDMVLLYAEILDKNGTLCTEAEHRVYFETEGDIRIAGNHRLLAETNPARAEAGIASAYLLAGKTAGKAFVKASAKGLCSDMIEISLIPPEYPDMQGSSFASVKERFSGMENLSEHFMEGDAGRIPVAKADGELYPDSIRLYGTATWKLRGESYLEMACRVLSGDKSAELLLYLDDVLRWRGKADKNNTVTFPVEGGRELKLKLRASQPTEVLLLSPYLWKGAAEEEDSQLWENIACNKKAIASVNPQNADKVCQGGTWLGGRTTDGPQEWQVDLGELFDVRNAKVYVGGQMGSDCTFYQYQIHTSFDGKHWEKQSESRRTSWSNGVMDYFTARDVRYVKVVFINVDGRLSAGIGKFEIYRDYGVDSVREYALSGIVVKDNDLVFSKNRLAYTLPAQEQLTIQALACDSGASVSICGKTTAYPPDGKILSAEPVTVFKGECGGTAVIEVKAALGKGIRKYLLHFS